MKFIFLLIFVSFISVLLVAQYQQFDTGEQPINTQLSIDVDYFYELIKFYLSENEFDLALTYLDSTMAHPTDSLYYFKGVALQGKKNWNGAADNFAQSIITHRHQGILEQAQQEFKAVLLELPAMESISLLSEYMNGIKKDDVLTPFLFVLAEVYEENQLFDEANDVYQTILLDTDYREKVPVELRIVTNLIFLKNYEKAILTLKPVISLNDSIYNEDALFFCYVAHYSLDQFEEAKQALLRLYQNYPDHSSKSEILKGLAELFEKENQLLMSWFFFQELKAISSEAQKFIVQKDIHRIKQRIGTEQIISDQFEYFKPEFEREIRK
jgi:tetratricopeptide (TPR) repeat protein